MPRLSITLAFGLLVATGAARAQPAITAADRSFLQDQAQGTAYELAIAKLAQHRGTQPEIKRYADTIVADHEALNQRLSELAKSRAVSLPPRMTDKQQANLARLQGATGAAFDRAYVQETTRINKDDKDQDAREIGQTADPAVKAFVQQLEQSDAKHLEMGDKLKAG